MMFDRALCVDMPEIAQQLPRIQRLRAALQRFSLTWIITRPAGRILCMQLIVSSLQSALNGRDRRLLQPFSAGKGIALRAGGQLIEHKTARGCRWILRAGARGQRRAASGGQDLAGIMDTLTVEPDKRVRARWRVHRPALATADDRRR